MNLLGTLPIGLSQLVSIGTSGVLSGQGRTPSMAPLNLLPNPLLTFLQARAERS